MRGKLKVNSREAIAGAWDGLCEEYVADNARPGKRGALAAVELAVIRKELANARGLRILDAGWGPGRHGINLALDGQDAVMTDISPRMLEAARASAVKAGVEDTVSIIEDDIRDSELESSSFDAIVSCGTVVSDCGDPDAALSEFARLLKECGVALFSVRNLTDPVGCESLGRRVVPQGHRAFDWVFFTADGAKRACASAGLTAERVYPVGAAEPPGSKDKTEPYVGLHMRLAEDPRALSLATELFVVATMGQKRQ